MRRGVAGGYNKAFTTLIVLSVVAAMPATRLAFLAPVPPFLIAALKGLCLLHAAGGSSCLLYLTSTSLSSAF